MTARQSCGAGFMPAESGVGDKPPTDTLRKPASPGLFSEPGAASGVCQSIPMKPTLFPVLCVLVLGATSCAHLTKKGYQEPPAAQPAIAADPSKPNSPANTSEAIETNDIVAQIAHWKL